MAENLVYLLLIYIYHYGYFVDIYLISSDIYLISADIYLISTNSYKKQHPQAVDFLKVSNPAKSREGVKLDIRCEQCPPGDNRCVHVEISLGFSKNMNVFFLVLLEGTTRYCIYLNFCMFFGGNVQTKIFPNFLLVNNIQNMLESAKG